MSHTHEQEMPQGKFERLHVHIPALQGMSSKADGKRWTALAMPYWDSHSIALMFRKETGDRRSPQAAGKSMQTWEDARRCFLPLVAFIEEPHMDSIQSLSSTPETMCPGKCKHHLCTINSTVLSQLQPVSTPALFNHYWHTCLVIWWSLDFHKPIATTLYGCCATPLCHLAWPWWVWISQTEPWLSQQRGCPPKAWWSPLQSVHFRVSDKQKRLPICRDVG